MKAACMVALLAGLMIWLLALGSVDGLEVATSASGIQGRVLDGGIILTPARSSVVIPNDLPPVAGATIRVRELALETTSDGEGRFAFPDILVPEPYLKVTVEASAAGFGSWQMQGATVRPGGNELELTVELLPYPQSIVYTPREEEPPEAEPQPTDVQPTPNLTEAANSGAALIGMMPAGNGPMVLNVTRADAAAPPRLTGLETTATLKGKAQGEVASPLLSTCSGYFSNDAPPPTIRVWRKDAGETLVRIYDFTYYLKNVLPNEWIPSWPANSLIAGSVAVENYGWYWVNNWRGGVAPSGECYDVDDSQLYQVFRPGNQYPSTDTAVDVAWSWIAKKSGVVFEGQYRSGVEGEACGTVADGLVMRQWGTKSCADGGIAWQDIVKTYYYPGLTFSLHVPSLMSGDYCGDAHTEVAVWRPSTATAVWYIAGCPTSPTWGQAGDIPVPGDYCGDSKTEVAVWRPSAAYWYISGGCAGVPWGQAGDVPVPGNYCGDSKTEVAVWRPSAPYWYISGGCAGVPWGQAGDVPVPGDYCGDSKTEVAVWHPVLSPPPPTAQWIISGCPTSPTWGQAGDVPVPGDYCGTDGKAEVAVWRPSAAYWYISGGCPGVPWGLAGDIALGGSHRR